MCIQINQKELTNTFYDDFKLKKNPLIAMVYTEIGSASSVKITTYIYTAVERPTAVTAYFSSKQLLLFVFFTAV